MIHVAMRSMECQAIVASWLSCLQGRQPYPNGYIMDRTFQIGGSKVLRSYKVILAAIISENAAGV